MDLMTPRGGIVRAIPADLPSDLSIYRPLPFSYAETARSQQQVFVAGVVSQFGSHVDSDGPYSGDAFPTDRVDSPTVPNF
jgi:hypothetical protein